MLCDLYFACHTFKLKIIRCGWGVCLAGNVMRARNGRYRRARRGRLYLRDLAGLADVERLLAGDIVREQLSPEVADDDAPADVNASSPVPRPQPGGGARRRR
jgi:hypothetical protein